MLQRSDHQFTAVCVPYSCSVVFRCSDDERSIAIKFCRCYPESMTHDNTCWSPALRVPYLCRRVCTRRNNPLVIRAVLSAVNIIVTAQSRGAYSCTWIAEVGVDVSVCYQNQSSIITKTDSIC